MKKIFLLFIILFENLLAQAPQGHVILIIIDGARYSETFGDKDAKYIPRMKQLAAKSAVYDNFMNDGTTMTIRAVPAIWCGSWSVPKDTVINGYSTQYATTPSMFEYFRKYYKTDEKQAIYFMKYLTSPWLSSYSFGYGPNYWPLLITEGKKDIDVWENSKIRMTAYRPALSLIYLADVDSYGHSGVWDDYLKSIRIADSIVGLVYDFIESNSDFKGKTTMIVTNDHGRHSDGVSSGFRSHGDNCFGCRHIMFLAYGPKIKKGMTISTLRTIPDIVPTIGTILNFPTPYVTGGSMNEIFENQNTISETTPLSGFNLYQNYPNPFNPSTIISFQLLVYSHVLLKVYDILGREVKTLINEYKAPGIHKIEFDGKGLSDGIYFYNIFSEGKMATERMMMIK